ncbi:MAG TPA: indole-3-glycerol phosphate synthase TrpC [Polyangia bacterium]|jgi:indole-3-glycerol phosphate synthase|nr:indole-3-glycerol phosphate synthase TrpC [Polyangia bacterium]
MILDDLLARTRADLAVRKAARPLSDIEKGLPAGPSVRSLAKALRPGAKNAGTGGTRTSAAAVAPAAGVACIAEFKRKSPSAWWIREGAKAGEIARIYATSGAAALSVVTNEPFFGGSLDDLTAAHAATSLPVMCKDFIVDAYQLAEARAAGADAALLIVAALSDPELSALMAVGALYGLELLVEAHDADEVARAVSSGAAIIGLNNRDLRTFKIDRELAARLRPQIPADRVSVAMSGIHRAADLERARLAAIDAILVGEALLRADDCGAALRELLGVGTS